jgi:hypothetical protein
LELRHLDQRIANIATDAFQFSGGLIRSASRPCFDAQKDERADPGDDQRDEGERERPGKSSPRSWCL